MKGLKTAKACQICGCCGSGKSDKAVTLGVAPKIACSIDNLKHDFFHFCGSFTDLKNFKEATRPL